MGSDFVRLIHHEPYNLSIDGVEIYVHDGVFDPNPEISYSTAVILNHLPDVRGKKVLDMGTGTGIIAIASSKRGAKEIVAVDRDEKALNNAKENIERNGVDVILTKSNLYENVSDQFDYIFANLPIIDEIWNLGEQTISLTERFLRDSVSYLKPSGKIYLAWFSASDVNQIQDIVRRLGYKQKLISEEKLGYTWYVLILEITQ